jgi:iron complex transport system substrate-binding protein
MFPSLLRVPHEIATSDFTPNVESILALNPDVVVQWSDSALVAPLESAGLKVVGIKNNGTQDDVDAWAALFATMLGKPARARSMKTRSDKELAAVRGLSSSTAKNGPSILYFNRFAGGLKVAATSTYNDFYISLVGGTNPATGSSGVPGVGMVGVDVEQVLAWDPEVILLGNFDAAMPDDLYSNPVYANVSAVRSRRVYKVPLGGYRWDPPGQESALMWHWLSSIAHPGTGSSPLRDLMSSYYRFLYSYRLNDAQMNAILWTDVNGASAHYQQFDA